MPSAAHIQEAKQLEKRLKGMGIASRINVRGVPKAQWYRGDGSALPTELPADAHHREKYHGRGGSMIPPTEPVAYVPMRVVGGLTEPQITAIEYAKANPGDSPPEVLDDDTVRENALADLKAQMRLLESQGATFEKLSDDDKEKEVLKPHAHRFASREIGSKCAVDWCQAERQFAHQPRTARRKGKNKAKAKRV